MGKLNNMSAVMASGDKRGDDSLQYQEVFDNDESCSLVNMPHAPMFYCSAGYFGDLLSFSSLGKSSPCCTSTPPPTTLSAQLR